MREALLPGISRNILEYAIGLLASDLPDMRTVTLVGELGIVNGDGWDADGLKPASKPSLVTGWDIPPAFWCARLVATMVATMVAKNAWAGVADKAAVDRWSRSPPLEAQGCRRRRPGGSFPPPGLLCEPVHMQL